MVFKLFLVLFLLGNITSQIFAAESIVISTNKAALLGEEEMQITASVSGFPDGEAIRVKGAFLEHGSSTYNYFGYTKNDGVWVKNSASAGEQREVTVGGWDGILMVKADFSDSGYKGEKEYIFKVAYYRLVNGSYSEARWSNQVSIALNEPDPTPTQSPQSTTLPTSTPQPTAKPTLIPTQAPTTVPTAKPSTVPTKVPTPTGGEDSPALQSTGLVNEPTLSPEGKSGVLGETTAGHDGGKPDGVRKLAITLAFVGMGLALLTLVFTWQRFRSFRALTEKTESPEHKPV